MLSFAVPVMRLQSHMHPLLSPTSCFCNRPFHKASLPRRVSVRPVPLRRVVSCSEGSPRSSSRLALALVSLLTTTVGGPLLAIFNLFFVALGDATGSPPWLCAISAVLSSALVDALFRSYIPSLTYLTDSGPTAFVVYGAAIAVVASMNFEPFFDLPAAPKANKELEKARDDDLDSASVEFTKLDASMRSVDDSSPD